MRVRYGKPIKVKNILGSFNVVGTSDGSTHMVARKEGFFKHDAGVSNLRKFSIINGHKYFLCAKTEFALSSFVIMRGDDWYHPLFTSPTPTYTNGNSYSIIDNVNVDNNNVGLLIWCNNATIDDWKVYNCIILDLTEIGLDNLTAQQFYNKYNKYFPLIATGEEITIDDKAGQVSLGSRLPREYQEVEYIESTGTQYINTNFKPNQDTRVKTHIYQISANYNWNFVFGARDDAGINEFETVYQKSANYGWRDDYATNNRLSFNNTTVEGHFFIDKNKNRCSLNGTEITHDNATFSINYTMVIFSTNYTGGVRQGECSQIRLYDFKLYDNNTLVRDFIPCYRKSDNVIGLYDLVGKQFYINQGTGTFLKGNDVNNTISCKVAGGSSDIYYGYNQSINNGFFNAGWAWNNGTCIVDNNAEFSTATVTCTTDGATRISGIVDVSTSSQSVSRVIGHKYFTRIFLENSTATRFIGSYGTDGIDESNLEEGTYILEGIQTAIAVSIYFTVDLRGTFSVGDTFKIYKYNLIDLTDWYGAGKEPTTVQEFKERFNKNYYGYCPNKTMLTQVMINALPEYGYNQWMDAVTHTRNGIIFDYNQNTGLMHIHGTATANVINQLESSGKIQTVVGHVYYSTLGYKTSTFGSEIGNNEFKIPYTQMFRGTGAKTERIWTATAVTNYQVFSCAIFSGNTVDFYFRPMCIDLTDWYGAGNEPSTIAEFKQTFPHKYYPYSKKTPLNKYIINAMASK